MTDRKVSLNELNPQPATFKLSNGAEISLRKFDLNDLTWIQNTLGGTIETVFQEGNLSKIIKLCYRMMTQESRKNYLAYSEKIVDEDGNETTVKVTGPQSLEKSMDVYKDPKPMMDALLKTVGISMPLDDNIPDEQKKS